ncbi:MAG: PilZ protein [Hyphomicrobiales bacterium]|nr:PilZ protein [Hyphomicrobiales bacterium]
MDVLLEPVVDRRQANAGAEPPVEERRMAERRSAARTRTLMAGRIIYNHGQSVLDCQVRNFSESGAKISLEGSSGLPDHFKLDIPSRGRSYQVEIRRRERDSIGVRFCDDPSSGHYVTPAQSGDRLRDLEQQNEMLRRRVLDLSRKLETFGISGQSF